MGAFRSLALIGTMLALAAPAAAHRLVVYAYMDGGEVVVEAKFSNGGPAKLGEIRLLDAQNALLLALPMEDDGETRVALPDGAQDGLTIEVETDAGHQDYWVLTPADLEVEG